uniref:Uncharacterized protein n=1 Tax=Avena sativa TaxID=4498 RepID=A0ACD5T744_AVESA
MARSKGHLSLLLLSAVVASLAGGSSAGIYHIVGAGKGWRIAPNRTYYEEWARTRNISIGDKLMFLYRSGVYNIVEVPNKLLFRTCSMRNITNRYQNGPTIIELTQPGPRFYFCGVGKHCEQRRTQKKFKAWASLSLTHFFGIRSANINITYGVLHTSDGHGRMKTLLKLQPSVLDPTKAPTTT